MSQNNNLFYAGIMFGILYFPLAALFYIASGKCLMYCSNRLYAFLIFLRHGDWYEGRLKKTIDYLGIGEDTRVLEVGCGEGKFSRRLLDAGANLKAIDINETFICKLQQDHKDTFELCSVTALKYSSESFDRVVLIDVLHHIPDYVKALTEIRRVLKPGGYAVIWEGSDTMGEEHVPPRAAKFMMRVLDGETNPVDMAKMRERFGITELEPYCYKLPK